MTALLNELAQFCVSDSLSEEGLREIFDRHGLTPNDNHLGAGDYKFFFGACQNERVTEGIIRCLIEYFPSHASNICEDFGRSPLHFACMNKSVTLNIIHLLIDAAPDSVRREDNYGDMPLHILCYGKVDEAAAVNILKWLIEKHPEAVRHADNHGRLPIHHAALMQHATSHDFCQKLIEAYPGSERITDSLGALPLNYACFWVLSQQLNICTSSIREPTLQDQIVIIRLTWQLGVLDRKTPADAVKVVQFLVDSDPNMELFGGRRRVSQLRRVCRWSFDDPTIDVSRYIDAGLKVIEVLFDAQPEAIEEDDIASNIQSYQQRIQSFINRELVYARQAKDLRLMMTPDDNGRLPLHTALQNNARLGSIKLLVKGNPSAIRNTDNNFAMPLHIACEHHDSACAVKYLIELHTLTLEAVDREGNTVLHYACRGAKYDTIALLLEKYDAVSVSRRNVQNKLPIELLWESNVVEDRESVEYTDSVFRLLKAYPETLRIIPNGQSMLADCPIQSGNEKKRKFGN